MRDNFTFNGNEYSVESTLRKGLTYRFINKNLLLRGSDLANALGYSYSNLAFRYLKFGAYMFVALAIILISCTYSIQGTAIALVGSGLLTLEQGEGLIDMLLSSTLNDFTILLLGAWVLAMFLAGIVFYYFIGHDYYLIRKELSTVLEKRKEEMFALNEEEEEFRREYGIVGETYWSITQADKRSLLEVILLEDVNTRSVNKKHINRKGKVVSNNNPELEQYRIRTY